MTKHEILDRFSDIDFAYNDSSKYETLSRMIDELLKEQEVKPVRTVMAGMTRLWYECPRCEFTLNRMHDKNFCGFCGQAVKWE